MKSSVFFTRRRRRSAATLTHESTGQKLVLEGG